MSPLHFYTYCKKCIFFFIIFLRMTFFSVFDVFKVNFSKIFEKIDTNKHYSFKCMKFFLSPLSFPRWTPLFYSTIHWTVPLKKIFKKNSMQKIIILCTGSVVHIGNCIVTRFENCLGYWYYNNIGYYCVLW